MYSWYMNMSMCVCVCSIYDIYECVLHFRHSHFEIAFQALRMLAFVRARPLERPLLQQCVLRLRFA